MKKVKANGDEQQHLAKIRIVIAHEGTALAERVGAMIPGYEKMLAERGGITPTNKRGGPNLPKSDAESS